MAMLLAIIILWLACLSAFLGSEQQQLLTTRLSKKLSLTIFIVLVLASWLLFCGVYSGVIAALLVLSLVMVMWLTIIFVLGHLSIKLIPFALVGSLISAALVQLGGL
ncbi:MAG: hypothetical protein MJK12_13310 [Colwellia sp.]|nr:hypothetical protein [Colwellia sp.]